MVTFCLISKRCSYLRKLTFSIIQVGILVRQTDTIMLLLHETNFLFQVVLAGAFYPNYFTFGQPDEEMAVRELAGKDPKTTIVVGGEDRPPLGLGPLVPFISPAGPVFIRTTGFPL